MTRLRLVSTAALFALSSSLAFAQAPAAPTTAPKPAAASPAPVVTPAPTLPGAAPKATAEQVKKVNLNTATTEELDKLPQIGGARSKAIIEARGKGKFKDWADFTSRKVVPENAGSAIKDLVTF